MTRFIKAVSTLKPPQSSCNHLTNELQGSALPNLSLSILHSGEKSYTPSHLTLPKFQTLTQMPTIGGWVIKDRLDFFALGTKLHLFKFSFSLGTRNLSCKGSWNLSEWAWNQVCVSITMPNPVKSVLITAWWCEGAPAWHGSVSTARMACTLSMRKGEGKARPSHHCESLITYRHHLLSAKLTPSLPQPEDWVHSAGF